MDAIASVEITTVKRALLVGVANYADKASCANLRTPAADVEAMRCALEQRECGFSVKTLVDPTRTEFASTVEEMFSSAGRGETVLLYFSGHGKGFDGLLHLCTRETSESAPDSTTVAVSDIKKYIAPAKRLVTILILDCCYSGLAMGSFKGGDVSTAVWEQLGRPSGTYIITSSSMTQPSIELHADQNSLFTKWMVKGLESWEAACAGARDVIYLRDLFDYVCKNVQKESSAQTPQYQGFGSADIPVAIARKLGAIGEMAATVAPPYLQPVRDAVDNKEAIFFLGDGIYRDGPLSSLRLIEAIGIKSTLNLRGETCLPTAAEEYQRLLDGNRARFLRNFAKIVYRQQREATQPAIYDMLARLDPPWLVLSTTHDLLLEHRLEDNNLPFVLVTHVLRDLLQDGTAPVNGKICIMRRGPQPTAEIVDADKLPDLSQDRVIYKLLGSPCFGMWRDLSPNFDPQSLDSVVVTEDDHVTFVGLLRHERTRVPTVFTLPLKRKSLVFFDLPLDSWNHRLIAAVFKERLDDLGVKQVPYAVRKSKSNIEDMFWGSMNARMIDMDSELFVRQLQAASREA
jgi:hypothetical protein